LATQGSHIGESLGPWVQSLWEQVPRLPQTPALQTPVQHCIGFEQGLPSHSQVNGPQTLPTGLQGPVQQGSLGLQVTPSGRQVVEPHRPLVQMLLQQGAPVQGKPSGLHMGAPQIPLGLQVMVQQSEEVLQTLPSGRQTGLGAQAPPSQSPVQQSPPTVHATPTAPHAPPHTPLLHTMSQQAEAAVQLAPTGLQVPPSEPPVLGEAWYGRLLRPQLASTKVPASSVESTTNNQV
jgi:hypothetical protein